MGVFCASKKDDLLRPISDCRYVNSLLKQPPWTGLCTPGAVGSLGLHQLGGGCGDYEGSLSAVNMSDVFYQYEYSLLASWFSLDAEYSADVAGITHVFEDDGVTSSPVSGDDLVVPCLGSLAMGGVWSLFSAKTFLLEGALLQIIGCEVPHQNTAIASLWTGGMWPRWGVESPSGCLMSTTGIAGLGTKKMLVPL